MTPEQRRLARHALGLDNSKRKMVYRNRFVATWPSPDGEQWAAICAAGFAIQINSGDGWRTYALNLDGALTAMERTEVLPRDFALDMLRMESYAKDGAQ